MNRETDRQIALGVRTREGLVEGGTDVDDHSQAVGMIRDDLLARTRERRVSSPESEGYWRIL